MRRRAGRTIGFLAVMVATVSLVFSLGYLFGAPFFYGLPAIPMEFNTALAFLLLGAGLIIASLVVGIDSMDVLKQDLAIARAFKPLGDAEREKLLARVKPVATDGRHERFKSTQFFDGVFHQKQHGLTKEQVEGA